MRRASGAKRWCLGAAAAGLGASAAALAFGRAERFWLSWVFWFLYAATVGLGALALVAIEHVANARWSVPLRRAAERIGGLVVFAAPLALVSLFSLPVLYEWARPEAVAENPLLAKKSAWLNVPFFSTRAVACAALWIFSHRALVGGSILQDRTKDPALTVRARRFAPAFLAILAATLTILAFDWVSSLEPEWYSDVFGVYLFAGSFLAGLAATALAVLWLRSRGRLPGVRFDHLYNLGGFLFAFTVFWSYIAFAQYMLIWYANIPEEVFWYAERVGGSWRPVALALALVHFAIPFFALVTRDAKGDPRRLGWVAALVLAAHALDLYWLLFPSLGVGPVFGWEEASVALFFLGAGFGWVSREMRRGEDMPVGDPFLAEGLEFRL